MERASLRHIIKHTTSILKHFLPYSSSSQHSFSQNTNLILCLQTCQDSTHFFQIQAPLITSGLFGKPFIASKILNLSANWNHMDYTLMIFRFINFPDTVCVNTVIKAFSSSSMPQKALVFYFEMMSNGFFPNSFTFPPLFSCLAQMGCLKSGEKCHGQAIKKGVDDVLPVENSLIHMYSCCGLIEVAQKMFDEMSQRDLVSWNSIVNGYVRGGDMGGAHKLFDEMPERNVVSWNVVISGYLKGSNMNPGCGLKLFRRMMKLGLRGSDTTMVSVLTACGRSASIREGKSVHGSLIRTLQKMSVILGTALIDMYSKCRKVEVAQMVFDRNLTRNSVCWNAIVLGHCIHGNPEEGLNLFAKMVLSLEDKETNDHASVKPDEITFIGVLCACVRLGLLTKGQNYFNQMINVFDIKPNFAHYWCMANLHAGVGLVEAANEMLRNMPVDDDVSSESPVWASLLGSCRFKGDVGFGEQVATSIIELEPQNLLCYGLLLNIYAVAGQWEDVTRVKELMKERGVRWVPGCTLVDLIDVVHKLKVGDKWQSRMLEINVMMNEVRERLNLSTKKQPQTSLHDTYTGS